MTTAKKAGLTLLLLFGLLAVSAMLVATLPDDSLLGASSISVCYLLFLSVAFYFYIRWVTIKSAVRTNLLYCGTLFAVIFLLRGARYIAFVEMDQVMRYLWYLYYVPLLFIPFFSFRAALSIGKADDVASSRWQWWLGAVCAILVVLVGTNDLHQLVFRLHAGFREQWLDRYTYGPLYFVVYAWIAVLLIGSLGIIFRKCSIASCRKQIWAPLVSGAFGIFWLTMIALGRIPSVNGHLVIEFPEAFCFTVAASWICCIRIGLIPANKSYISLLGISSIHAMISDWDGNVIYRSREADEMADGTNIQTQRRAVRGGYVSWQTDVAKINQINEELDSVRQQLEEETELLRLENALAEKNKMLEAKSAVYDAIAVRVLPQSTKISELTSMTDPERGQESGNLRLICLYGCYIKRMSNLMLIAAQQSRIGEMELALAIGESANYLRQLGVHASVFAEESDRSYDASCAAAAYETFERYIEQALPSLAGVQVTIVQNACKLMLECSETQTISPVGDSMVECEDGTFFIAIPLRERGGSA